MPKRKKYRASLEEILKSIADSGHMLEFEGSEITLDSVSSDGDMPLHIAAFRGDRHAVEVLLESGAKVDVLGGMGCTPLYNAVMSGNASVVKLLIESGANPEIESELGYSPRSLAVSKNDREILEVFNKWSAE